MKQTKREQKAERQKLALSATLQHSRMLSSHPWSVNEYRKGMRDGWSDAVVGICLRSGDFYVTGRWEKAVCVARRWCVTCEEVDSIHGFWLDATAHVVRPVGQKGIDSMREALRGTMCKLPLEGVSEKAVQNLDKCGLYVHVISGVIAMLREVGDEAGA